MNTSNNRRFQKTEKMIQDHTMELLEEHSDFSLTIDAICRDLPFNRSSFYLHHKNLQSLMDAIMKRVHMELMDRLRGREEPAGHYDPDTVREIFTEYLLEHKGFFRYYAEHSENRLTAGCCILDFIHYLLPDDRSLDNLSELQVSYLAEFLQAGLRAVLDRWLEGRMVDPIDEIMELFLSCAVPPEK